MGESERVICVGQKLVRGRWPHRCLREKRLSCGDARVACAGRQSLLKHVVEVPWGRRRPRRGVWPRRGALGNGPSKTCAVPRTPLGNALRPLAKRKARPPPASRRRGQQSCAHGGVHASAREVPAVSGRSCRGAARVRRAGLLRRGGARDHGWAGSLGPPGARPPGGNGRTGGVPDARLDALHGPTGADMGARSVLQALARTARARGILRPRGRGMSPQKAPGARHRQATALASSGGRRSPRTEGWREPPWSSTRRDGPATTMASGTVRPFLRGVPSVACRLSPPPRGG
jgi:hypothetical protein